MDRINIGIVGLHFGRYIVEEEIANGPGTPHFKLAAVCSQEPDKTNAMAEKFGCRAYHDLDELLSDKSIPCIGLFTGPVGRANLIRKVIRAGKDVMTTKPFELDPMAARNVLEEAAQLGRVVHLNSPSPLLSADLQQMVAWQEAFDLGQPIGCRADVWVSYREKPDGSWYDDPALCPVPPIFRLGIYLINDLVRLFGPAERVAVTSSRIFTGRPTADNGQLSIAFKSGALANIFGSFCVLDGEHYKNALTLNYERGTIYRNAGALPVDLEPGSSHLQCVQMKDRKKTIHEAVVRGSSGTYQWDAFARAVRKEPLATDVTVDQIVNGIAIIQAMYKSEKSGMVEPV